MRLLRWYRRQPRWWRMITDVSFIVGFILGHYYDVDNYRVWYDIVDDAAAIAAEAKAKQR